MIYDLPVWDVSTGVGDTAEGVGYVTVNDPQDGARKYMCTVGQAIKPIADEAQFMTPRATVQMINFTVSIPECVGGDWVAEMVTDGVNVWFLVTWYGEVEIVEFETLPLCRIGEL